MGRIRRGPPKTIIEDLQDEFSVSTFVETGTFYGSTAHWASDHFEKVVTIELDDEIYREVSTQYKHIENIQFINGESQTELQGLIQNTLNTDTIFWLDAHYSGEGTAGKEYECPLLEEIEALGSFEHDVFVFIDDARLFLSPPPRPHNPDNWPTIREVIEKLNSSLGSEYYIVVVEDVIIAVPRIASSTIRQHTQDIATENTEQSDVAKGIKLIWKGVLRQLASDSVLRGLKKTGLYPIGKRLYTMLD